MNVLNKKYPFTNDELFDFIDKAGKTTYAGDAEEVQSERPNFIELFYTEGDFSYRDSYTGHYRSRGMEVVRYKEEPIWSQLYGGGMVKGQEAIADETFTFLKKAFKQNEKGFDSFRGPHHFQERDWIYTYEQEGDLTEFHGYEEISFKGELVFFHRTIGGIIEV